MFCDALPRPCTHIPVARLIDRSGFGYAVGCVEADASNNIQEITSMGGYLMCNDDTVSDERVRLIYFGGSGLICGNSLRGSPRGCLYSFYVL